MNLIETQTEQQAPVLSTRQARLERHQRILDLPDPTAEGWFAAEIGTERLLVRLVGWGHGSTLFFEIEAIDAEAEGVPVYRTAVSSDPDCCSCNCGDAGRCRHVRGLLTLMECKALVKELAEKWDATLALPPREGDGPRAA